MKLIKYVLWIKLFSWYACFHDLRYGAASTYLYMSQKQAAAWFLLYPSRAGVSYWARAYYSMLQTKYFKKNFFEILLNLINII